MTARIEPPSPVALRISVTDRCQLRCVYCLPADRVPALLRHEDLRDDEIVQFVRVVGQVAPIGTLRLTGGEPLLRPGLVALVRRLRELGPREIAVTTNGHLLPSLAMPLREAGVSRINLSLDSLDERTYAELTGGGNLRAVMEALAAARRCGFLKLKLNMVVLRGLNDHEVLPMIRFAAAVGAEVRFLELMPIGGAEAIYADRCVATAEVRQRIEQEYELTPVQRPDGSTSRTWRLWQDGREVGRVGFVSSKSHPFCSDCRRIRLTADGHLLGCLARPESMAVRGWLAEGREGRRRLRAALERLLSRKTPREQFRQPRAMAEIGG